VGLDGPKGTQATRRRGGGGGARVVVGPYDPPVDPVLAAVPGYVRPTEPVVALVVLPAAGPVPAAPERAPGCVRPVAPVVAVAPPAAADEVPPEPDMSGSDGDTEVCGREGVEDTEGTTRPPAMGSSGPPWLVQATASHTVRHNIAATARIPSSGLSTRVLKHNVRRLPTQNVSYTKAPKNIHKVTRPGVGPAARRRLRSGPRRRPPPGPDARVGASASRVRWRRDASPADRWARETPGSDQQRQRGRHTANAATRLAYRLTAPARPGSG
jgi:hypothetical protein